MTRYADVVIVGGGVTGASLAYHLTLRGVRRVVVLERRFLAAGGTGRSVGVIRQLYPTPEATRMVVRSLAVFREFAERVGAPSGFVASGVLIAVPAALADRLEGALARQRALGARVERLAPDAVGRVDGRLDPGDAAALLWEPDAGYADPAAVTAGFAAAARRRGARIEQGAEVVGILRAGDRVAGVVTATGERIAAPLVVNAAGLWARDVARLAGLDLPIVVGRHPVIVLERDPDFGPPHPVYLDLAGGAYLRPETGGLTLAGALTEDETRHPMDPAQLGSEVGLEEATPRLARAARALPRLGEARVRRGYAGAFDITPDWMPILDETPLAGFWVAAGMSGHGFKLAPAIGEMLAARLTGATPPVSPAPFRLDRFAAGARPGATLVASYLG